MEQMLEGEMDPHLAYEKHSPEGIKRRKLENRFLGIGTVVSNRY